MVLLRNIANKLQLHTVKLNLNLIEHTCCILHNMFFDLHTYMYLSSPKINDAEISHKEHSLCTH